MRNGLKQIGKFVYCVALAASVWCAITSTIMGFKHPEMTEMQLFLAIPKTFVLNFEKNVQ